jgi:hypothetical protein
MEVQAPTIETTKLNDFYLYGKGHYGKSNDRIADLKVIHADLFGIDVEYVEMRDLAAVLAGLAYGHLKSEYKFLGYISDLHPMNTFRVGYFHSTTPMVRKEDNLPEYDYNTAIVYASLSLLTNTRCMGDDIQILNIGVVNPKIQEKLDESRKNRGEIK